MILEAYNKFKNRYLSSKNEEQEVTEIPTSKPERLSVNNKVREVVKKKTYTEEDIKLLKRYTGFGGLNMGDKDEYFTPKELASAMVDIVDLQDGQTILDPCVGGGIFPLVAKEKANLNVIAVEPNPLSAKVSSAILGVEVQQGYLEDYEGEERVDSIITNVPFGLRPKDLRDKDPKFKGITRTEDYIILKSLGYLKDEGMGIFITNSRLMNGKSKVLDSILLQGEILGAVRLPNSIFADSGADVATDIIVIKKHKAITKEIGKKEQRELLIEPFDIANYFSTNPSHIIGNYTSKEEAVAMAIANGEKVHHLAQKDTVVSDLSHAKVFAKANEIMKTFKPTINYKTMVIKADDIKSEESFSEENETARLSREMNDIGNLFAIAETDITRVKKFMKDYEALGSNRYNAVVPRFIQAIKLYDLGITDNIVISKLIGYYIKSQSAHSDVDPRLLTREEWDKYEEKLSNIAKTKPSWSSDGWVFEKVVDAYKKFNKEDESVQVQEIEKRGSISDYSEEEIINNTIMSINGEVLTPKSANKVLDGMTKEQILSSLNTKVVQSENKDKYLQKVNSFIDDNIRNVSPKNITIDLPLVSQILDSKQKKAFLSHVDTLKSLENKYVGNILANIEENDYLANEENEIDPIVEIRRSLGTRQNSSILRDFIGELILNDKEPRFKAIYKVSDEAKEALAMVTRTEFYNLSDIITSLIKNFIDENEEAKKQLAEYAESKSIFVSNESFSEDKLSEVSDLVSVEWLDNSHHYQNSDARKFSESEDGVIRYDTGLGKSLEAMLIGAKLVKKGKRVAYIVPNEIIGKMEAETKKVFSSKMLEQTLVVTSDDKESILKAVSSNKHKFLLMTSSVLATQFHLEDTVTVDLFGHDQKTLNAGEKNVYKVSMRSYVSRKPKWDSKSSYSFEDLNLDTMIIDEAHRFKNAVASASSGVKGLTTTPSNVALIMLYFAVYTKYVKRNDGKGVILSTATPITSSPTEMLTTLLFSTDIKGMRTMGIDSSSKFEKTFFNIVKKNIIKTDGTMRNGKVLEGIKNLDILRNLGYRKVVKRTAEEESLVAKQNGKKINVKPSSTEIRIDVDDTIGVNREFGETLNEEFSRASNTLAQMEEGGITEDEVLEVAVLREFGSMFSYLDKYKKSSISVPTALGYTQIVLKEETTKDELLALIGNIKVKHKIVEAVDTLMQIDVRYKIGTVAIRGYDSTEYMRKKIDMYGSYCLPILESDGKTVNIPSIEYDVVKKVVAELKKKKVDAKFEGRKYNKLYTLAEKVAEQFIAYPNSKQIVYATTLSTHIVIEKLIQDSSKDKIKFFHFNGSTVKNAEKKLKMQEDFNDYKGKAVLVFGSSGKVGVDFNKNVSSVHLLDVGLTPEDKEQAKGRAVRQGNSFENVSVFNYYQNNTLDSFLEGIVGNKQEWIDNVEDTEISSSSFNSDTLETIAKLAEKKYRGESGTVEEKIKKYLVYMEEEKKRKAEVLEKAFTDQAVSSLVTMSRESEILRGGYGHTLNDAKRVVASDIVGYIGVASILSLRKTHLTKREFSEYVEATAKYMGYVGYFKDSIGVIRKTTVVEVKKAIADNLNESYKMAMDDPSANMRGTLSNEEKLAQAYGKDTYTDIFYELVTEAYNRIVDKIETKAEYLFNIPNIVPNRIEDIKRRLKIEDTVSEIILEKLKVYDGEYLHGKKGMLMAGNLDLGYGSSQVKIGEAYLNFYKVYSPLIHVHRIRGAKLETYIGRNSDAISIKSISPEDLAEKLIGNLSFESEEKRRHTKNEAIALFDKVVKEY